MEEKKGRKMEGRKVGRDEKIKIGRKKGRK